jgi:hypothetical protein
MSTPEHEQTVPPPAPPPDDDLVQGRDWFALRVWLAAFTFLMLLLFADTVIGLFRR